MGFISGFIEIIPKLLDREVPPILHQQSPMGRRINHNTFHIIHVLVQFIQQHVGILIQLVVLIVLDKCLATIEGAKDAIGGVVILVVDVDGTIPTPSTPRASPLYLGKHKFILMAVQHQGPFPRDIFLNGIIILTYLRVIILYSFLGDIFDWTPNGGRVKLMPTPEAIVPQILDIFRGLEINHRNMALIQPLGLVQKRNDIDMFIVQFRQFR
jgi:hypothetical protein